MPKLSQQQERAKSAPNRTKRAGVTAEGQSGAQCVGNHCGDVTGVIRHRGRRNSPNGAGLLSQWGWAGQGQGPRTRPKDEASLKRGSEGPISSPVKGKSPPMKRKEKSGRH